MEPELYPTSAADNKENAVNTPSDLSKFGQFRKDSRTQSAILVLIDALTGTVRYIMCMQRREVLKLIGL